MNENIFRKLLKKNRKLKLVIFFILILLLIGLCIAPILVRSYLVKNSLELVGRTVSIDKLKYNYFTSTAKVYGFKMYEANKSNVFVAFDTLVVNLEPLELMNDNKVIEDLYLQGLSIHVKLTDSVFNFDDIISFYNAKNLEEEKDSTDFKYSLSNLKVKNASFDFTNNNVDHVTSLNNIAFAIPYIGWNQKEKSNADVKLSFKNGGYLESKLNINAATGEYDANIEISKLNLEPFYNYIAQYAEINSVEGLVNINIDIIGNTNAPMQFKIIGEGDVNDFNLTDKLNKKFLGAKYVHTTLNEIDYHNSRYLIKDIDIQDSYTYFQLDSMSNNFFRIFKIDMNETEENTQSNISENDSLYIAIDNLKVTGGVLDYTDNLTGNPFNYHLSDITLNTKDIESTKDWITINSSMILNNRGNLLAEVGFNPQDYYNNITFDIAVEKFLLPDLNIYTKYYMGHNMLNGDMYYYSKSKVIEGKIESENRLLVKNAKLENVKGGLYQLPLKFAFFLLTDKNGDVNLEVPVKGDTNDPKFKVGKIIWQAFKNVITKTVSAPINFLAGLVGGDPKDLKELEFSYTDSIPTEKHYNQMDKLIELEQKKPGIGIELTYYVDNNLQKEALAKAELGKEFKTATNMDYEKDSDAFKKFIFNKIVSDSLDVNKAVMDLANNLSLDSLSTSYSNNRISKVIDYLKKSNDSTKIIVRKADILDPEQLGSFPIFKIKYGMEEDILENENQ